MAEKISESLYKGVLIVYKQRTKLCMDVVDARARECACMDVYSYLYRET